MLGEGCVCGCGFGGWGELNTGKRPPAVFVLDTVRGEVQQVRGGGVVVVGGERLWRVGGELNTGKRPPAVFVLDTVREGVKQVLG